MQTQLYKKHIFNIFFKKYLDMSKKSSTFAPDLKKTLLTTKIKNIMKRLCYLSIQTMRVFATFNDAWEDAKMYCNVILEREPNRKDVAIVYNYTI